ncbi:MAG: aromatic ring-hydroxylating oxygenase subunit alpha [Nocardioidaceae bacterium]
MTLQSPGHGGTDLLDHKIADLVVEEPGRFRVHSDVYVRPDIFALEMSRIFETSWVFVAHESMVPNPGDYCTGAIGRQPVIISRDDHGEVHVLFNRCAHRGSVVCREERGHAATFRCPYHGWMYRNDGTLIGAAQRSGYPKDFDTWGLRLGAVPNVETYRGLIFANIAPDCEPLTERLSGVLRYVDAWCDRAPDGEVTVPTGAHRYDYPGNWKLQMENGVDGYHGNYVHESYANILERSGERKAADISRARNRVGAKNYAKGLPHGDGLLERADGMLGTYDTKSNPEYRQQIADAYGDERMAEVLTQRNIFIFPNLYLFESHIRVIRPVEVDQTYVDVYPTTLVGASDQFNRDRLTEHQRFFGPASFGQPDDIEIFVCAQTGVNVGATPWMELSRGLAREEINEYGERVGHSTDENPQRSIYREWRKRMSNEAVKA